MGSNNENSVRGNGRAVPGGWQNGQTGFRTGWGGAARIGPRASEKT
jgi:hypothetical protein